MDINCATEALVDHTDAFVARALEILAANSSAPIFGVHDTLLGKGLVGGQMTDFVGKGRAVGRLVQRIRDAFAERGIGFSGLRILNHGVDLAGVPCRT